MMFYVWSGLDWQWRFMHLKEMFLRYPCVASCPASDMDPFDGSTDATLHWLYPALYNK